MKNFILRELLRPTLTRVGAMVAGYLVATIGTDPDVANQISVGISAVGLVLMDLITRKVVGTADMEISDLRHMREPDGETMQFASILPFLLPALIGVGTSLIGGAMKNSAAKRQAEQQYENDREAMELQRSWDVYDRDEARAYDAAQYAANRQQYESDRDEARAYGREALKHLVTDADAAGFNPLTVLRGGGGAGYAAPSNFSAPLSSVSSVPLSRQVPVRQAPNQGHMGDAVAGAGGFLADFMTNFDPMADDKRELEFRLVNAQIANLDASTRSLNRPGSFNVPSYTAGNVERRPGSGSAAHLSSSYEPNPVRFGRSLTPEVQTPNVTNPWPGSWGVRVDPNTPDAEMFENRYGEFVGSAMGSAVTMWRDLGVNDPRDVFGWRVPSEKGPRLRKQ